MKKEKNEIDVSETNIQLHKNQKNNLIEGSFELEKQKDLLFDFINANTRFSESNLTSIKKQKNFIKQLNKMFKKDYKIKKLNLKKFQEHLK